MVNKRIALIAGFGIAMACTWPIYSLVREARRDAAYQTAIAPFRRDLHIGMAEQEVEHYLNSRHVEYHPVRLGSNSGPTYEIRVGEEGGLICDRDVYIALEFGNSDRLREVHIKKIRTCLELP